MASSTVSSKVKVENKSVTISANGDVTLFNTEKTVIFVKVFTTCKSISHAENGMATSTIKSNKKYGNITASNGCVANEVSVVQEGSLICIKCWFNKSAGIGTAEIEVGTLSGVDLPSGVVRFSVGAGNQAYALTDLGYGAITSAGDIRVKLATSRPNIVMNVVYSI